MEITPEELTNLGKGETVILEDIYGDFSIIQKADSFLIEAQGLRLEIARPCGPVEAVLMAFEAFTETLGNWPEV